jgi:phage shock protein A
MSLLQRLWDALGGAPSDGVMDPERQLSSFVGDLDREIERLQRAVAAAMADEKRLKMQIEDLLGKAGDWERRAILALEEQNETLARQALAAKEQCELESLALQKAWEAQRGATEQLKASLRSARARVSEAKTKYTLLLAQYRSATTKARLQQTLSTQAVNSPMQVMERLSDRIRLLEAQTEAAAELEDGGSTGDLDATFAELERRKRGEEALKQLKAKLETPRQLTDGTAPAVDRIAELKAKLERA